MPGGPAGSRRRGAGIARGLEDWRPDGIRNPDHRHRRPGPRYRRLAAVPAAAPGPDRGGAARQDPGDPAGLRHVRGRRGRGQDGGRARYARGRHGSARYRAPPAVGGAPGPAARPAGPVAELDGLGAAEPAVPGPPRRRHLGRDRRGADHGRRGRGACPADGRRPAHQGQGARHPGCPRGARAAPRRAAHPARRGHRPVAAHRAARRPARGGPHGRRERHRQDHHLRQARARR